MYVYASVPSNEFRGVYWALLKSLPAFHYVREEGRGFPFSGCFFFIIIIVFNCIYSAVKSCDLRLMTVFPSSLTNN